jgi:hypothetical protein
MEFTKPFNGCKKGDIYPTAFAVGDECPVELEAAAAEAGAIEVTPQKPATAAKK